MVFKQDSDNQPKHQPLLKHACTSKQLFASLSASRQTKLSGGCQSVLRWKAKPYAPPPLVSHKRLYQIDLHNPAKKNNPLSAWNASSNTVTMYRCLLQPAGFGFTVSSLSFSDHFEESKERCRNVSGHHHPASITGRPHTAPSRRTHPRPAQTAPALWAGSPTALGCWQGRGWRASCPASPRLRGPGRSVGCR